jgi:hypothetical protein
MHERKIEQRLEEIQLAEVPEVLRVASELYARDRAEMERAARRQELLRAAAEAGLPVEYLDRAAATIHARRAARLRRYRRWRMGAVAALGLTLGLALVSMQAQAPSYIAPLPSPPRVLEALIAPPAPTPPAPALVPVGQMALVDLGPWATHSMDAPMLDTDGNDLSDLDAGYQVLGGVGFYMEGVVLVGPGQTEGEQTNGVVALPEKVEGITLGRKAQRLYFLQGAHFSAAPGTRIGSYVVHYEDGTSAAIPIRFGEDVLDWWDQVGPETEEALNHVVWRGKNDAASRSGVGIRLFMKTWENPRPEMPIASLDMVTGDQPARQNAPAPFLAALTAQ